MSSNHHSPTTIQPEGINIRRLGSEDRADVDRLAQLDSERPPDGALIGVSVEGRLVAVISLATGESIADPFSRTAELRALLELRAAQLRRRENGRRRRLNGRGRQLHLPRPRSRAALAGSPPGAARWWLFADRR